MRLWTSPSTRPSSTQSRWFGEMRNIVEHRQPSVSSVTTVRAGATSRASRLTRWISVPTAQTDPSGLFLTVADDVLGRAALVGRLHDVERALGMDDDLAAGMRLPELLDLLHGEARVDAAVALPQNQPRAREARRASTPPYGRSGSQMTISSSGTPIRIRGVPAEVLVGQHQQLLARVPRPRHHLRGVARRADDAAVLAAEAFDGGGRVDVGDGHDARARRASRSSSQQTSS